MSNVMNAMRDVTAWAALAVGGATIAAALAALPRAGELGEDPGPATTHTRGFEVQLGDPRVEHRAAPPLSAWAEQLANHRGAPSDPRWAGRVEPKFASELRDLSEGDFELVDVDCRANTCLATVQFATYSAAAQKVDHLLQHPYTTDCAAQAIIPEPEDRSAAYVAELLFDCE